MKDGHAEARIELRNGIIQITTGGRTSCVDLNEVYRGYLPPCLYTAAAVIRGTYYACGTREDGRLLLVSSGDGETWTERPAEPEIHPFPPEARGDAAAILADPDSGELLIACAGGVAEILPDCPRCARAVRVCRAPVTDAEIRDGHLLLFDNQKEINRIPLRNLIRHRINLEYAVRNGYLLVDLRPRDRAEPLPVPSVPLSPEQLPDALPDTVKAAFFAEDAETADRAAELLVRNGRSLVRSLGDVYSMLTIQN